MMESQLVEAWRMSNESNIFLLDHLSEAHLEGRYANRARTVAAQFAHMHAVRLRWLGHAAPKLANGLESFPRGAPPGREELKEALIASEESIAQFLQDSEATGKVKGWNGTPATFLGYLIAHEAHHRGLAMAALRVAGHKLPNEVVYGLWDWGKKRSMR